MSERREWREMEITVDGVTTREWREVVICTDETRHPRAEVRDSETGEVIFPAVKGPLQVIRGGRDD